jgi:hypothetical protein
MICNGANPEPGRPVLARMYRSLMLLAERERAQYVRTMADQEQETRRLQRALDESSPRDSANDVRCAVCLQHFARQAIASRRIHHRSRCALAIQSRVRQRRAMRQCEAIRTSFHADATSSAAVRVQRFVRGVATRHDLYTRGAAACAAILAVPLQRWVRGVLARTYLVRRTSAAVALQSLARGHRRHCIARWPERNRHQYLQRRQLERALVPRACTVVSIDLATSAEGSYGTCYPASTGGLGPEPLAEKVTEGAEMKALREELESTRRLNQELSHRIADELQCPITHEDIHQLVVCGVDGRMYEKVAIEEYVCRYLSADFGSRFELKSCSELPIAEDLRHRSRASGSSSATCTMRQVYSAT